MKRLPDSELELMMIIWEADRSVTRTEIEEQMDETRQVSATTVLSFLSRLVDKGFLAVEKEGKTNRYRALVEKDAYMKQESRSILKRMYQNSVKNFLTALSDGENLTKEDIDELQEFLNQKKEEQHER